MRILAVALMTAAGAALVTWVYAVGLDSQSVTGRDYIQYWAAERLLVEGYNPYDPAGILHEQQSAGMADSAPKVSLSPPIAVFFALPLGMVNAKKGLIAWQLVSIACLCLSILLLWQEFGRQGSGYHLLGLCFPPVISCLMAGQLGLFFLLSAAFFLRFNRTQPWLAGAALLPCALKPHLFLPLAVVLVLWSLRRKDLRVLGGFLLALLVSCSLSLWVDPRIWSQYRYLIRSAHIMDVFIPTVSVALRFAIDRSAHWIEFVPVTVACAWVVWYYWTRREIWEWKRQGMLLLMVSVAAAPYSWFSDEAVLLPAVLAAIYTTEKTPRFWALFGLIALGGMVGTIAVIQLPSPFYVWTAPAWLGWYLYATSRKHGANAREESVAGSA